MMILQSTAFLVSTFFHYVFTGITSTPSCGIQADVDLWTAEGTININDTSYFRPQISIPTSEVHCKVDLTSCSSENIPTTGELCVCLDNSSNSYTFLVRRIAKARNSNETLRVEYRCQGFITSCYISETLILGQLPLIYDPPSPVYRILGCQGRGLCSGEDKKFPAGSVTMTTTVTQRQFIQLEFCVYNLIDGVITLNGRQSRNACTDRNAVLDTGRAGTSKQVVVTFQENGGCQRNGQFTLTLVAEVLKNNDGLCEN